MSNPGLVIIKSGRDKPLRQFHPWVFSGAVFHAEGEPGGLVTVRDFHGDFIGTGYYNPDSQIAVRILSWDESETINADWWRSRLQASIEARAALADHDHLSAYRLIYAESDGLPGLIVDCYGDALVLQSLTLGIEQVKSTLVDLLVDLIHPAAIVERSDVDVRNKEGLPDSVGMLHGDPPPEPLTFEEYGLHYPADLLKGHKTGFYLDQRDTRRWLLTSRTAEGKDVLNAFSYTGAFSLCAASTGAASIVNIDTSQAALDLAAEAMKSNGLERVAAEYVAADVFQQLRAYRDSRRTFDLIILDPPKFVHSSHDLDKAARGYKDINLLALKLLRPGGLLMTFSCSGLLTPDLFQKIVFGASLDAECRAQIIAELGQPADHPILLSFPEGRYLKGLVCRVAGF